MSLLKAVELYFGDHVVTYGELREFVRLTSGEDDQEEVLMGVDEFTGRIESFSGYVTEDPTNVENLERSLTDYALQHGGMGGGVDEIAEHLDKAGVKAAAPRSAGYLFHGARLKVRKSSD